MLCADLQLPREDIGPGCWCFNPTLLGRTDFKDMTEHTITSFFENITDSTPTEERWEDLKFVIQYAAKQFSKDHSAKNKDNIQHLQQIRSEILNESKDDETVKEKRDRTTKIQNLEDVLYQSIKEETKQYMLRSAIRWQEQGEKNNKFFFRIIKQRQSQQTIQALQSAEMEIY